jgi:hypothetical protein
MSVALSSWLLVTLRRRAPEAESAVPARVEGNCFGPMSKRDEVALKGFVAGDDRAADVLRWGVGDGDLDS